MSQTRVVMFRESPTYIPPYSPNISTLSGCHTPSSTSSSPSIMTSSISSSTTDPGILSATTSGETLLFMRRVGEILRKQPGEAADKLTEWLLDDKSPRYWRSMVYSLRGCAREQLGETDNARQDYSEGIRMFERLEKKTGREYVDRLRPNAQFMEYRLKFLGGRIDYLVISQNKTWY